MNVILDLDGVIWLAEQPIAGSSDAVRRLRAAGHRVLFLTNNSNPTTEDLAAKLTSMGIPADPADIATSSEAAAGLVAPGERALVCGGPGVREALRQRGVEPVDEVTDGGTVDAVVVGFHREFNYGRLNAAFQAVHAGARLIGTNDDATYPMPGGPVPGGGAILAAVATASGVEPIVAGKPYEPMAALVRARLGTALSGTGLGRTVMVGDRRSTDGRMANRLGVPFAHVQSGVDPTGEATDDVTPAVVAPDLASLVGPDGDIQELA